MSKILMTKEYREYMKRLKEFQQQINPKPSAYKRKKLAEEYLKAREQGKESE